MSAPAKISKSELLHNFDTFVFDADGVLWTGDIPIPGAAQWINLLLQDPRKSVFITTNNATKTLDDYVKKVEKHGFGGLGRENILTPAIVLAAYLKKNAEKFAHQKVYLMGTESLKTSLETLGGVQCYGVGEDPTSNYSSSDFVFEVDLGEKPKAVVLGFDSRFSYMKLLKAANYLADESVEFLVTNEDYVFPGPNPALLLPETGPWSAAIQAITGRKPDCVFGKPHKAMAEFLTDRVPNLDPKRTVMFGDRLQTDIIFGNSNGFSTVWMPTGTNTIADVEVAIKNGETLKIPKYTCRFSDFFL